MIIFEEPVYTIVTRLVLASIFFTIQLMLCYKASKNYVKLIPIYSLIVCGGLCIGLYFGLFGTWSGSFLGNVNQIVASILAIIVVGACLGEIIAWLVYTIRKRAKN